MKNNRTFLAVVLVTLTIAVSFFKDKTISIIGIEVGGQGCVVSSGDDWTWNNTEGKAEPIQQVVAATPVALVPEFKHGGIYRFALITRSDWEKYWLGQLKSQDIERLKYIDIPVSFDEKDSVLTVDFVLMYEGTLWDSAMVIEPRLHKFYGEKFEID